MMDRVTDHIERTVPPSARGVIERAMTSDGRTGVRNAIKAKCLDCCHYDRDEVRHCTVWRCPLHAYRPYRERAE